MIVFMFIYIYIYIHVYICIYICVYVYIAGFATSLTSAPTAMQTAVLEGPFQDEGSLEMFGALTTPDSWRGSPKVNSPTRQLFSKVEIAFQGDYEAIHPIHHSGVAGACRCCLNRE